ncbi:hypothetical protein V2J09_001948 [Rumex salicifolius]
MGYFVNLVLFFLVFLLYFMWKIRSKQFGGLSPQVWNRLPPGSMGLPFLGETLQLFSQNPNQFFMTKQLRYGEMFKTHILGCPCIMLASPDAIRFVLVTKANLFKPTYPKSKERLIGSSAIFYQQGGQHSQIRKLVQASLSLDTVKGLISSVESIVTSLLDSLSGGHVVHTFHELKKARKALSRLIVEIIKERRERRLHQKNLLQLMLSFRDVNGQVMSDKQVIDNVIGVLFAAQDTTASLLTWILKFITDDINILHKIKVIQESQRMASIISFTYREAIEDVEYNGYLIPKGWKVLPLFRNIHHNQTFFEDAQRFNPSRFENGVKALTFIPFGMGMHSCPGNELAKLQILVFIHHLLNKFRWELVAGINGGGVTYSPFPVPEKGLPARFWKFRTSDAIQHVINFNY